MTRKRGTLAKNDFYTLRLYWQSVLENKKLFWKTMMVFVASVMFSVVAPFAMSAIIANLVSPDADMTPFILLFGGASAVGLIANRIGFIALMTQAAAVTEKMRVKVYEMLMKRGLGFYSNTVSGKVISDALDFPRSFTHLNGLFYIDTIPFLLTIVIGLGIIVSQDIWLGLIMFIMTVFLILWAWLYSYLHSGDRATRKEAMREASAHTGDTITNVLAIKSSAQEEFEVKTHKSLSDRLYELQVHDWVKIGKDGSNRRIILTIIQIGFIFYLIELTRQNPESLTVGIFAFTYSLNMTAKMFQINQIIRQFDEALLEAAPMAMLLQKDYEINDDAHAKPLKVKKGSVSISDLEFKYPDGDDPIFSKFSLDIAPKERIGLVGPSGGGKSSLMKLLLRFQDIDDGKITIDGQDISKVTQKSLRQNIAYVPQEPLLFHRTVLENITYGAPQNTTDKDIANALKKAYAKDFVENLPKGLHTVVGERGVKLSGGQKQRIAIARAILRDAPILLLDEATSALDSESEKYIQKALHQLMQNKTVVVIAHRLSTINELDRIVVVDDGKIAEQGNHRQLLKSKGMYSTLWKHQSGGFLED